MEEINLATRVIWKYVLNMVGTTKIQMPIGALFLSVGNQHETLTLWVLHDKSSVHETRRIQTVMTGEEVNLSTNDSFLGTVPFDNGNFIVHVFEKG